MNQPNPPQPTGPSAEQLAQYDRQLDAILARYTQNTTGQHQGHSFASTCEKISTTPVPSGQAETPAKAKSIAFPDSRSASETTSAGTTSETQSAHHQLPRWPGPDYFWEAGSDYARPPPGAPGAKVPLPPGYFLPSGHPAPRVAPT